MKKWCVDFKNVDGTACVLFIEALNITECINELIKRDMNQIKDIQLIIKEVKG